MWYVVVRTYNVLVYTEFKRLTIKLDADSAQVVTPNQLQLVSLYEQFSAAAYCTRNELVQPGTVIACNAGNCPIVEEHGATVEFSFLK